MTDSKRRILPSRSPEAQKQLAEELPGIIEAFIAERAGETGAMERFVKARREKRRAKREAEMEKETNQDQ